MTEKDFVCVGQMLVYLFYFLPFYVLAIHELLVPGQGQWLASWSVIHAGAAAQVPKHLPVKLTMIKLYYIQMCCGAVCLWI